MKSVYEMYNEIIEIRDKFEIIKKISRQNEIELEHSEQMNRLLLKNQTELQELRNKLKEENFELKKENDMLNHYNEKADREYALLESEIYTLKQNLKSSREFGKRYYGLYFKLLGEREKK